MSFGQIMGKVLSNMGPGLLSGIGSALQGDGKSTDKDIENSPKPPDSSKDSTAKPNSFKDGGEVKKTGLALVHKGEHVIPADHKETVNLSHHRVIMHLNKGGLHRALSIPEDQTIPDERLQAARKSGNTHVREMANLANSMKHWHDK